MASDRQGVGIGTWLLRLLTFSGPIYGKYKTKLYIKLKLTTKLHGRDLEMRLDEPQGVGLK